MKKFFVFTVVVLGALLIVAACGAGKVRAGVLEAEDAELSGSPDAEQEMKNLQPEEQAAKNDVQIQMDEKEQADMKMNVQVGGYTFTATLEDNAAVQELVEMMREGPVSIDMSDYAGFEKVGALGRSLTASNSQTTTAAGDIVLYNGNNIVMFYGSNSWSYTRIGKIDDLADWEAALGSGDITAVFALAE